MNDPWNFSIINPSPDHLKSIEYEESSLMEFAMGSPLHGNCYLMIDNRKIKLEGLYGGPPIWSDDSKYVAIPKWTKDRNQRIGLLNLEALMMIESQEKYSVLQFESFHDGTIKGIDSPIYQTREIAVNIKSFE